MWNWLYGPERDERDQYFTMRSLKLDIDAVRDTYRIIDSATPADIAPEIVIQQPMPVLGEVKVAIEDLTTLADSELRRIYIRYSAPGDEIHVDLREKQMPMISSSPGLSSTANDIARFLLDEGRPRVRWQIVKALPATLAFLSVAGLGAALLLIHPFERWSQNSLAVAILVLVAGLIGDTTRRTHKERLMRAERSWRGHCVEMLTREQIRTQRANTRANLRVSAITAAISGPLGAAIGALLNARFGR